MTSGATLSRRLFLAELGRGTVALAVVSIAGCAPAGSGPSGSASGGSPAASAAAGDGPPSASTAQSAPPSDGSAAAGGAGVTWERVNLGFVSAYVLARGGEAAVVDTGTAGSEGDIGAALERIGLGWDAVGHVIVTHRHSDHVGGLGRVLQSLPPEAIGYAGAEDIPVIPAPESLVAAADGDVVFGLTIIATPGHTPGHISVLDEVSGILIAGDALGTTAGQVTGPNPRFTPDMATALESVAKLGTFQFETLLVGHGEPIVSGASELVAAFKPA
jgi:glyoxylase-like metal-dependent hydrolase (beta-lactamase superfamily II)